MKSVTLTSEDISKEFNRRVIFANISFSLSRGDSMAITGKNGAGKSTLVKILCGLLSPTKGTVSCSVEGCAIPISDVHRHLGLVSPYINMYDEFTGSENLRVIRRIRTLKPGAAEDAEALLQRFGIYDRRNDEVRTYSSGMKQRLKYATALLHRPKILLLDEPTANLDDEGVATVRQVMREQIESGILIIATNDTEDLGFAERRCDLNRLNSVSSPDRRG